MWIVSDSGGRVIGLRMCWVSSTACHDRLQLTKNGKFGVRGIVEKISSSKAAYNVQPPFNAKCNGMPVYMYRVASYDSIWWQLIIHMWAYDFLLIMVLRYYPFSAYVLYEIIWHLWNIIRIIHLKTPAHWSANRHPNLDRNPTIWPSPSAAEGRWDISDLDMTASWHCVPTNTTCS